MVSSEVQLCVPAWTKNFFKDLLRNALSDLLRAVSCCLIEALLLQCGQSMMGKKTVYIV